MWHSIFNVVARMRSQVTMPHRDEAPSVAPAIGAAECLQTQRLLQFYEQPIRVELPAIQRRVQTLGELREKFTSCMTLLALLTLGALSTLSPIRLHPRADRFALSGRHPTAASARSSTTRKDSRSVVGVGDSGPSCASQVRERLQERRLLRLQFREAGDCTATGKILDIQSWHSFLQISGGASHEKRAGPFLVCITVARYSQPVSYAPAERPNDSLEWRARHPMDYSGRSEC